MKIFCHKSTISTGTYIIMSCHKIRYYNRIKFRYAHPMKVSSIENQISPTNKKKQQNQNRCRLLFTFHIDLRNNVLVISLNG